MKKSLIFAALAAGCLCMSCTKAAVVHTEPEPVSVSEKVPAAPTEVTETTPAPEPVKKTEAATSTAEVPKAKPAAAEEPAPSICDIDIASLRLKPSKYIAGQYNLDAQHLVYDYSTLYFLGFSKDGKLAVIEERLREGVGATETTIYVQDLVTDEILWKDSDNGLEDGTGGIAAFVDTRHENIDAALQKYGIKAGSCAFKELPYKDGSSRVDVRVTIRDTGKLMYDMLKVIDYDCIATDGKGREKTVCSKKEVAVEDVYVCGYIKNPFEGRLAIVIAEKVYGFEGCDLLYSIVGCRID